MAGLRTIFMGTADLACASLRALSEAPDIDLIAVVSQPDKPKGRDLKLHPTPVKALAQSLGLPVLQPLKARDPQFIDHIRSLQPDLCVVAAYGQILPQTLLNAPRHGCLNVHTSLLPKYRGAAPIQWAILNGDTETGVTIMQMDAGLDTGPILSMERTPIAPEDDSRTLHDRLAVMGGALLVQTIPDYVAGSLHVRPQPAEGASYARKITKDDGLIDWSLPARTLWCRVRGLCPWPGAWTWLRSADKPMLLKLWQASPGDRTEGAPGEIIAVEPSGIRMACGDGSLRVTELQLEGRRRMSAREFLAGHPLPIGTKLG